jgi:outer membrane protein TolC
MRKLIFLAALFMFNVFYAPFAAANEPPAQARVEDDVPIFSKEDFIASAAEKKLLRIGMVDCVAMALKNNSEILVKQISPLIEDANVKIQKAVFEPDFSYDFSYEDNMEVGSNTVLEPAKLSTRTGRMDFGYKQKLVTGTKLELDFYNTRQQANFKGQAPNPAYDSLAKITVTQPILKGWGIIVNKADFLIAKNNELISKQDLAREVIKILTDVKKSYYDFQYAQEQYKAVETALERSEILHQINK